MNRPTWKDFIIRVGFRANLHNRLCVAGLVTGLRRAAIVRRDIALKLSADTAEFERLTDRQRALIEQAKRDMEAA